MALAMPKEQRRGFGLTHFGDGAPWVEQGFSPALPCFCSTGFSRRGTSGAKAPSLGVGLIAGLKGLRHPKAIWGRAWL
jgi:hypothetical protein